MPQTTSTGAKKILDSDNWREIFADHNDTVDAYDGVITGTVSVITGTTNNTGHTIAAGEYFIANGSKYKATASIPSNTAWASSATAVSDIDIINSLNSAIKTVSTNLGSASSASSVTGADAFSKIDALNSKLAKSTTYTSQTTAEGYIGLNVSNDAIVDCVYANGYVCWPFKNSSGGWRAHVRDYASLSKPATGTTVTVTTYYHW
jgi:hypothetical protein